MSPLSRYSRWDGTQGPWADADDLLEGIGDDLLQFGDLSHALRRMMQRGFSLGGRRVTGLQSLAQRLRSTRRSQLGRYDMDSVAREIVEALDEVRELEAREVADRMRLRSEEPARPQTDDDPLAALERQLGEPPFGSRLDDRIDYLDRIADRPADALQGLQRYDFLSPEAEAKFNELVDRLRKQVLQQYFRGAEQALANMTEQDLARVRDMLGELNEMIRRHEAGEPYDFDGFMQRHGEFFPDNPRNLEELLASLARRMAAAQAMMASMSPEQRQRLEELSAALLADAELAMQMSELGRAMRDLMPSELWEHPYPFEGDETLSMSQAVDVLQRMQDSEDLERYLRGAEKPSDLSEVDLDRVTQLLGPEAAQDLRRLAEIEKMLSEAGYVRRSAGRLDLTPAGVRRIGRQALGSVYSKLRSVLSGEHEDPRSGHGGELAGDLKPYEFGDPFHIQVKETVFEAVRRSGAGTPVRVRPDDFVVERTERRVQAATALCVDLSLSMPMRGNWVAAKKVGLALHALISTMFPRDRLYLIGFSDYARRLRAEELPGLGWEEVYGTNLEHALLLARRQLGRHRDASRQVIVVTDGEPTSHLLEDGSVFFDWPARPETIRATLREVARCTRDGIVINTFMLDRDPGMRRFVQQMTALNRGRAFYTTPETLGEYVLVDFLESKRSKLRGA